jgi:hypothetical protein
LADGALRSAALDAVAGSRPLLQMFYRKAAPEM